MRSFTVREWEALPHGEQEGCIPPDLAGRLAAFVQTSVTSGRGDGVLEDRRRELRARGVVGVIAAPGCSLEILPKIEVSDGSDINERNATVRKRLVHMLAIAFDLKIEVGRITELEWQRETLLEILIRIFCEKLTEAVRRGVPRRYVGEEDDLPTLRGTLNVSRQFTTHLANPARLACRFDSLSEDIALNQIMKAAVLHLSELTISAANRQRLRELAFVYADIASVPPSALKWGEVVLDRTNRSWQELLEMSRLFLRNHYQSTNSGSGKGTALLFEMSALFEEFVGRLVARALAGTEYSVTLQGGRLFCLASLEDGRTSFQTKPDILIRRYGDVVHVIDTKWKRVSARIDDPKQGVSQADVYQMMAYAHLYRTRRLTLLYPHHFGLGNAEGIHAKYRITDHDAVLEAASINVAQSRDMVARLRSLIAPETVS